jgi:uncharacterized protein with HEPN domain
MKDPLILVSHILDSIYRIEQYMLDIDENSFYKDFLVQDAVIRNLEIIGEASRSLTKEFKGQKPDVPWRKINAMRNKLIHEYFIIDIETVWNVVQLDLPELKQAMLSLLNPPIT